MSLDDIDQVTFSNRESALQFMAYLMCIHGELLTADAYEAKDKTWYVSYFIESEVN